MLFYYDQEEGKNICSPNLYSPLYWKFKLVNIREGKKEEKDSERDGGKGGRKINIERQQVKLSPVTICRNDCLCRKPYGNLLKVNIKFTIFTM